MTGPAFAAALSEHPDPVEAAGEVLGQILEKLGDGDPPDLALLFVTPPHVAAVEQVAAAVRAALRPRVLLGCTAETVVGGGREVERGPGVSVWAGRTGPVVPFTLSVRPGADGAHLEGWPPDLPEGASAVLLLGDPFSLPADDLLEYANREHPGLPVVGGMASAARGPGGNRLVLDDRVHRAGAVGAVLGPGVRVETVVSQGCRPIGSPYVVTKADGSVVHELGGRTALERLGEVAQAMPESERALLGTALHFGRVIDEHKAEFGRGDFLIRNVMGGDPNSGAIAVADVVEVGSTAQFQVRDARSADDDLRHLLAGHAPDAALLFTCNGRGTRLFDVPDHDAGVVAEHLGRAPIAGMSCAGELGPVGNRNFLHGFTASVLMLTAADADGGR